MLCAIVRHKVLIFLEVFNNKIGPVSTLKIFLGRFNSIMDMEDRYETFL